MPGAVDPHLSVFEGLAQLVEHCPAKFGQLIEKQHPMVSEGQFPRPGLGAAADQPRGGAAVVGASKGAGLQQALAAVQQSGHRVDRRQLEGFGGIEGRQQPGEALGQHRFAAARRAAEQQVMPPRSSDLQGTAPMGLSLDVGEIRGRRRGRGQLGSGGSFAGLIGGLGVLQPPEHLAQIVRPPHLQPLHQGGFPGIGLGHHKGPGAIPAGCDGDGENTPDRPQRSIEAQLRSTPHPIAASLAQLTTGLQQPQGNG